jgi:phosphatidate cytidylyltransferase
MELNTATLRTRSISAAVFVVIMLAGLLISHWTFFVLFSFIHFGCWVEYQKIIALIDGEYKSISPFHRYGVMLAGWCLMLYFTNDDFRFGNFLLHPAGFWLGLLLAFLLPITELLFASTISVKNIGYSFLGILYISLSFALLTDLLIVPGVSFQSTPVFPILLISCMWINDTMAYIVGSLIGKTPLSSISPKKTWEGTAGGIVLCVAVVSVLSRFIWVLEDFKVIHFVMIALIAALAGTFGDLLESKLKRLAGIKDSGAIMPGHGGFLDRFDSLLLATPFVWLYVRVFLK